MRALITESAGYYANLIRGSMNCPHDACSAYYRRGMWALITEIASYYANLFRAFMCCPHGACRWPIPDRRGMRALITESASYYAEMMCGSMNCPHDAHSVYYRRDMRALLTNSNTESTG
jgi:hypothetical protein